LLSRNIYFLASTSRTSAMSVDPVTFFREIGSPRFVVAPMVDQSELAFRMLCRKYGAQLCYTPMFHSRLFAENEKYRIEQFQTCPEDRPLFVQFCGNHPETILRAAKFVEDQCDAIDLNFGCPQGIAKKGRYGAFLLEQPALIGQIVHTLAQNLKIPVTCKIRLLPTFEKSLELCQIIVAAGAKLICIHGRTKEETKERLGACDWETIRRLREHIPIPVIANGGIMNLQDINNCLEITKADGVMTSEAILENPSLFIDNISPETGEFIWQHEIAREYLRFAELYPPANLGIIRGHLIKILFRGLQLHGHLLQGIAISHSLEEMLGHVSELEKINWEENNTKVLVWYHRYRTRAKPKTLETEKTNENDEAKECISSEC